MRAMGECLFPTGVLQVEHCAHWIDSRKLNLHCRIRQGFGAPKHSGWLHGCRLQEPLVPIFYYLGTSIGPLGRCQDTLSMSREVEKRERVCKMASMESISPLARLSRPWVQQIGEMTRRNNINPSLFFLLLRQSCPISLKSVFDADLIFIAHSRPRFSL